jgi:site-specific DNA recombinase
MKGSIQKAKEGGTPFLAPIGYLNVRDFSDGKDVRWIDPDPERAPLIRWPFEAYGSGVYSLKELLEEVTKRGLTNRPSAKRPARPLHLSKLAKILTNKFYVGTVVYGGVEYAGKHEPLVDQDLFDRVQRVLRVHDVAGARLRVHKHYLKGSLRCYRCKSRMGFSYANGNGGTYPYFFCYGRHRGEGCTLPYLAGDDVEDQMIEHYRIVQIVLDRVPEIREKLRAKLDTNSKQRERMAKRANARLDRLTHERDKLLHAYYDDLLDDEQFKAEQDRITRDANDASEALAEREIDFSEVEGIVTRALEVAADCQQAYLGAPDELRQKLNQLFFKRLEVDTEGIARTELSDEMSILIGEEIAPSFQRAERDLAFASVGSSPISDSRDRELVFSGVGSSKTPLVDLRGVEPLTSSLW